MTLQVFGTDALRAAIDQGISLAEDTERLVETNGSFDIVTPAQLAVVTFAPRPWAGEQEEELVRRIVERTIADGLAMLTSTTVYGRTVLRMCTINPSTTVDDVRLTIDRVAQITNVARQELDHVIPTE